MNVADLPLTLPVWSDDEPSFGSVLGIGRGLAYEAVRRGDVKVIRIGRTIRVPRRSVLELLGEVDDPQEKREPDLGRAQGSRDDTDAEPSG